MTNEELLGGTDKPGSYYPALHFCRVACTTAPTEPYNWATYTSTDQLTSCKERVLFDFNICNPVADPLTPTKMRVCSLGASDSGKNTNPLVGRRYQALTLARRDTAATSTCVVSAVETTATLKLAVEGPATSKENSIVTALEALGQHFSLDCTASLMLSYIGGVVAGLYGPGFGAMAQWRQSSKLS